MKFNRRKDREIRQRLKRQRKYASRYDRLPTENALSRIHTRVLNGAARSSDFSGYGDSMNPEDKYYIASHFQPTYDIASERTIASSLGEGPGIAIYKPLLVIVGFLTLAYYLSNK